MTAPVYQPVSRVDGNNVESFRQTVIQSATRYGHGVIDCSDVGQMGPSAMRVLAVAARHADVVLVNPNETIRLMAAAYDIRIATSGDAEPGPSHT